MQKLRSELASLRDALASGKGQELELRRQMEAQLEAEREKRIAHLGEIGVKRMMNQKLSMGWSAWLEMYEDYQRKKRLLKNAGARLTKPKLVHAFAHWQADWDADVAEKAAMSHAERLQREIKEKQAVEAECSKLRSELRQAREAMANGTAAELEMQRKHLGEMKAKFDALKKAESESPYGRAKAFFSKALTPYKPPPTRTHGFSFEWGEGGDRGQAGRPNSGGLVLG